jgi:acetyltransferase-like isoleucine patch superfamily enzyme
MSVLEPSSRAPGLYLGPGVELPDDVDIGAHVVIHAGVRIGAGCRVQSGAVIGKQLVLGALSTARSLDADALTVLEPGAAVGCHAVIVAGASVGEGAVVGDHTLIREHARMEAGSVLGSWAALGRGVRLGARSKVMNYSFIAPSSTVEEDVFVGPRVTTTNDPTLGRHGPADVIRGIALRRGCRIAASVTFLPGVEVGEEALVGAASLVTHDVPARMVVLGTPARVVRAVEPDDLLVR